MIFKVLGINIEISVPFAVIIAFLLVTDTTGLMSASLLAVSVHEAGHLVAMKLKDCAPASVKLGAGGILIIGSSFCTAGESIIIALAGPLANFLLTAVFMIIATISNSVLSFAFAAVQLLVGAVNLLPVRGLDGGTILRFLLIRLPKCNVELTLKLVSIFTAVAITVIGVAVAVKNVSNPSLLLLGLYLIIINSYKYDR